MAQQINAQQLNLSDEVLCRRSEELEALQAVYGEDVLPSLISQSQSISNSDNESTAVSATGRWFVKLGNSCPGRAPPILEIQLPANYPSGIDPPKPILHNVTMSATHKEELFNELLDMYIPETEVAIMWAERCREDLELLASEQNNSNVASESIGEPSTEMDAADGSTRSLKMVFLSYNHLLHGKEHKKEAELVSSAAAMGLVGIVVYSTPGIVGVLVVYDKNGSSANNKNSKKRIDRSIEVSGVTGLDTTEADLSDFIKDCGRIGKRAQVCYELELSEQGLPIIIEKGGDGAKVKKESSKKNKGSKAKETEKGNHPSGSRQGIAKLLFDLLEGARVESQSSSSATIVKTGLNAFSSLVEFKQVLMTHGADEALVKKILGLT